MEAWVVAGKHRWSGREGASRGDGEVYVRGRTHLDGMQPVQHETVSDWPSRMLGGMHTMSYQGAPPQLVTRRLEKDARSGSIWGSIPIWMAHSLSSPRAKSWDLSEECQAPTWMARSLSSTWAKVGLSEER